MAARQGASDWLVHRASHCRHLLLIIRSTKLERKIEVSESANPNVRDMVSVQFQVSAEKQNFSLDHTPREMLRIVILEKYCGTKPVGQK